MEPQLRRGISVRWTRPKVPDIVLAMALGYLLYQQPDVPQWGTALAVLVGMRCIQVSRTV
ncbi:hypothetical protein ACH4Q7_22770 [Streptomyces roseolus]|uniref:hypothetical protein n=1 Tax=Streptomyces roseolus TaxID=67358 RepID=UPI003789349B